MTTSIPLPTDGKKIKALFDNPNSFQITNDNLNFPFQCYFVGGRLENIKDVILPALRKELGMNFMFGDIKIQPKSLFLSFHLQQCLSFI